MAANTTQRMKSVHNKDNERQPGRPVGRLAAAFRRLWVTLLLPPAAAEALQTPAAMTPNPFNFTLLCEAQQSRRKGPMQLLNAREDHHLKI